MGDVCIYALKSHDLTSYLLDRLKKTYCKLFFKESIMKPHRFYSRILNDISHTYQFYWILWMNGSINRIKYCVFIFKIFIFALIEKLDSSFFFISSKQ